MKYLTYSEEQKETVKILFNDGKNKCEISRITGIPRSTLKTWLNPRYIPKTDKKRNSYSPIIDFENFFNDQEKRKAYAFILGVYLSDGYISLYKTARAPSIKLFNDIKFPKNTQEWAEKLKVILPENTVNIYRRPNGNCLTVGAYSRKLTDIFPQHGKGPKWARKMRLENWQEKIINEFPEEFVRASFQSDGCIYTQTLKKGGYSYKKYSFSNKSEDIIDFFLLALEKVGIKKNKYYNPKRGLFVVQNFSKPDLEILNRIIPFKE